ncbi:MAG TPA: pitrilysin family protein [Thermoanaerobaculia bacterium]|nr:pitrilysin family protein [Thermoanaerobaculia bacterium]
MKRVMLAAVCCLFAAVSFAQVAEQTTPPAPSAPHQPQIPTPVEKTLANGLRVIVVETHNVPLVSARLAIKTGAEADPAGHAGLADTTAALLTKGTTTKSAEEIARGVEALGASLDSGAGFDVSNVDLNVMSPKLSEAMAFLADVVRHPTFKKDEIERQKAQAIDSLNVDLHDPDALAHFVLTRVVFGAAPYGHNLGGTPESIARITREDVAKFHQRYYRPDNAVLVMAGEVKAEDAFALAQKLFGGWKGAGPKPASAKPAAAPAKARVVVIDMPDAGQAAVYVARAGLRRADPQYLAAQVANAVLGGGYSSRLNEEIRIKRGLSYGAGSGFDFRRDVGPFTAGAQTKNESAAEVAGLLIDEMNRMATTPVEESELTPRKATLIGDYARGIETSRGLTRRLAALALYGLPLAEISHYITGVQAITPEQVREVSKSALATGAADVIIVGDAKKFLEPLKARFKDVDVIPAEKVDLNAANLRRK